MKNIIITDKDIRMENNNINKEKKEGKKRRRNSKEKHNRPRLFSRDVNDICKSMLSSSPK
jgi:hypothetical protein